MFGGREIAPILAFVGVSLASGDGMLTERDKLETVCQDIRMCVGSKLNHDQSITKGTILDWKNISLKDLQLGDVIAKGCNAIVHSARWKEQDGAISVAPERSDSEDSSDSGTESSVEAAAVYERCNIAGGRNSKSMEDICKSFDGYDLAVKMMFNYEAESNAPAILRAMHKEIVPARNNNVNEQLEHFTDKCTRWKKSLPAHPNIVDMHCLFADSVPRLPHAMSLYPDALPKRLNCNGAGRNMTLFLVMKRYHCSLQEYLLVHDPSPRTCLFLMAQLLEGIVHLGRNGIAHRDLKLDNILLCLSEGPDYPLLVITDFGCCLADEELGLQLPYYTEETDRGGNSALMAPEVACARPGYNTVIDYSKADLWAVGALAYEIFGQQNPFYRTKKGKPRLDSRTYSEADLPSLPDKAHPMAQHLIKAMLRRNPRNRPDPATAANVFEILLFGPKQVVSLDSVTLYDKDVVMWLATLTARLIIQQSVSKEQQKLKCLEQQMLGSFLLRTRLDEISKSMEYFYTK